MVVVGVVGIDSHANMTLRQKEIEKLRQGNFERPDKVLRCPPYRTTSEREPSAWTAQGGARWGRVAGLAPVIRGLCGSCGKEG